MKPHQLFMTLMSFCLLSPVHALSWHDLWKTKDQQAQMMMKKGDYKAAEQTFKRDDWRAAAAFRAKNYQQAAALYAQSTTKDAYYNAGNALAQLGQYQRALQAYDQALALDSADQDVIYNRKVIEALVKKESQSDPKANQNQQGQQAQSNQNQPQNEPQSGNQSKPSQNQDQSQSMPDKQTGPSHQQEEKQQPPETHKKSEQDKPAPEDNHSTSQDPSNETTNHQTKAERDEQQAKDQWLRLIPDDPGGLLREKFLRDYLRRENAS